MNAKFDVGAKVDFRLYSKILQGTIIAFAPKTRIYEIASAKLDVSRHVVPLRIFVKEKFIVGLTKADFDPNEQR